MAGEGCGRGGQVPGGLLLGVACVCRAAAGLDFVDQEKAPTGTPEDVRAPIGQRRLAGDEDPRGGWKQVSEVGHDGGGDALPVGAVLDGGWVEQPVRLPESALPCDVAGSGGLAWGRAQNRGDRTVGEGADEGGSSQALILGWGQPDGPG